MANTIQHKRSTTASSVPSAGQLAVGELALNLTDKKIYSKDGSGNVVEMSPTVVADGSITTAKIADASVTTAKIADANVTIAKLSATGTPSSSTFLRGDGSWQSAGGGVTSLNGQTGAITDTNYGAIGSYTIAWSTSYNSQEQIWGPDVTVAGSTLTRSSDSYFSYGASLNGRGTFQTSVSTATGGNSSLGLSGTWRCLTRQKNGNNNSETTARGIALWVRIS